MGRTSKEIMSSLPEERRKKIETQSKKLMQSLNNKIIANLIVAINQHDDPQLCDEAYKLIMERIDELMDMNGGEGPDSETADGLQLDALVEAAEGFEEQNFG